MGVVQQLLPKIFPLAELCTPGSPRPRPEAGKLIHLLSAMAVAMAHGSSMSVFHLLVNYVALAEHGMTRSSEEHRHLCAKAALENGKKAVPAFSPSLSPRLSQQSRVSPAMLMFRLGRRRVKGFLLIYT